MNEIPESVKRAVRERDNYKCSRCDNRDWRYVRETFHHCFPEGTYRLADFNDEWNLVILCGAPKYCHNKSQNDARERTRLEALAYSRRPKDAPYHVSMVRYMTPDERKANRRTIFTKAPMRGPLPRLERAREERKDQYRRNVQKFRDTHGGMSPMQWQRHVGQAYASAQEAGQ